ncbi:MAG: hypothetical protein ACI4WT_03470 [Oligosphaeraceae bacterium]
MSFLEDLQALLRACEETIPQSVEFDYENDIAARGIVLLMAHQQKEACEYLLTRHDVEALEFLSGFLPGIVRENPDDTLILSFFIKLITDLTDEKYYNDDCYLPILHHVYLALQELLTLKCDKDQYMALQRLKNQYLSMLVLISDCYDAKKKARRALEEKILNILLSWQMLAIETDKPSAS